MSSVSPGTCWKCHSISPVRRIEGDRRVGVQRGVERRHAAAHGHPRLRLRRADVEQPQPRVVAARDPGVAAGAEGLGDVGPGGAVRIGPARDGRRTPQLHARIGVVAGDEAAVVLEPLAAVDAADQHPVCDHRTARMREALPVVGLDRAPGRLAAARVERHDGRVVRGQEDLVPVEGDRAGDPAEGERVRRKRIAVNPRSRRRWRRRAPGRRCSY